MLIRKASTERVLAKISLMYDSWKLKRASTDCGPGARMNEAATAVSLIETVLELGELIGSARRPAQRKVAGTLRPASGV